MSDTYPEDLKFKLDEPVIFVNHLGEKEFTKIIGYNKNQAWYYIDRKMDGKTLSCPSGPLAAPNFVTDLDKNSFSWFSISKKSSSLHKNPLKYKIGDKILENGVVYTISEFLALNNLPYYKGLTSEGKIGYFHDSQIDGLYREAIVDRSQSPKLGDEIKYNFSQEEIQNINKILSGLRSRLGKCELLDQNTAIDFIMQSLNEFNLEGPFTSYSFKDTEEIDKYSSLLIERAVLHSIDLLAKQERGRETTTRGVSELLQERYNIDYPIYRQRLISTKYKINERSCLEESDIKETPEELNDEKSSELNDIVYRIASKSLFNLAKRAMINNSPKQMSELINSNAGSILIEFIMGQILSNVEDVRLQKIGKEFRINSMMNVGEDIFALFATKNDAEIKSEIIELPAVEQINILN